MCKLAWQLVEDKDKLWVSIIRAKYDCGPMNTPNTIHHIRPLVPEHSDFPYWIPATDGPARMRTTLWKMAHEKFLTNMEWCHRDNVIVVQRQRTLQSITFIKTKIVKLHQETRDNYESNQVMA
ncbi:hypothetical protein P8452_32585 [Trifolium repens]|nr:hypothetical protein P8452_32585 [Trifolium repens]